MRLDRLRQLRPTHVVVNVDENRKSDVDAIESFAPHVVVTHPLGPGDNPRLYRLLGAIFARDARAEALAGEFAAGLRAPREAAAGLAPLRVLYLIWKEPWMTVSRDTYVSRTLALVRWETAAHDPGVRYPVVALGEPLFAGVDLVLLSSEPYPFKPEHAALVRAAPRREPGSDRPHRRGDGVLVWQPGDPRASLPSPISQPGTVSRLPKARHEKRKGRRMEIPDCA